MTADFSRASDDADASEAARWGMTGIFAGQSWNGMTLGSRSATRDLGAWRRDAVNQGSFSLFQSSNVFRRSVSPGLESKACLERSPGGL